MVAEAGPEPRPNDLIETVHEALSLQESELEQSTITLETRFPAVPCVANFDRILMRQLITNLMQNAIEAIVGSDATERRISVAVDTADDAFEITIEDSGPGIDPRNFPGFANRSSRLTPIRWESVFRSRKPFARRLAGVCGGNSGSRREDPNPYSRRLRAPTSPKRPVDQEAPTETELPPSATP
ncbi:MAG: ATP-binding protein [Pirellulaceae bacterium]